MSLDGHTPDECQRLLDHGWRFGWLPPAWDAPLVDTDEALELDTQLTDVLERDQLGQAALLQAAEGDGYLQPLTVPDAPPADWVEAKPLAFFRAVHSTAG